MPILTYPQSDGSTITAMPVPLALETEWMPLWHPAVLDTLTYAEVDELGANIIRQANRLYPTHGGYIKVRHRPVAAQQNMANMANKEHD